MSQKEINKIFEDRIKTFLEYVDIFDDEEEVELYLYDYIAFIIRENNRENISNQYIPLLEYLLKMSKNNIVLLKGSEIRELYDFVKEHGISYPLKELLLEMYKLNEEKRILNYKEKYNYCDTPKKYKILVEVKKNVEKRLMNIEEIIHDSYKKYNINKSSEEDNKNLSF